MYLYYFWNALIPCHEQGTKNNGFPYCAEWVQHLLLIKLNLSIIVRSNVMQYSTYPAELSHPGPSRSRRLVSQWWFRHFGKIHESQIYAYECKQKITPAKKNTISKKSTAVNEKRTKMEYNKAQNTLNLKKIIKYRQKITLKNKHRKSLYHSPILTHNASNIPD